MIRLLLIAVQFLTRLPVPNDLATTEAELGRASGFFPLVGALVGGLSALVFTLAHLALPLSSSVLLALLAALWLTNGFHEDGLADSFDGFGGGWTKDRTLEIMRDSRLGSYGVLALVLLLLGKYDFLSSLPAAQVWRWLIVAHTASRWTVLPLCAWLPYARAEGQGKLVAQRIGATQIIAGTITLLLLLILSLLSWAAATLAIIVTGLVVWLCGRYFRARLQGLTGDCLGAANQLTEVSLYLLALVLWRWGWL